MGRGTLLCTLSQKHQSTSCTIGKRFRPKWFHVVCTSNPVTVSLLSVSHYLHHAQTQHVGDLKGVCIWETGIVFSNSIVRMCKVTAVSPLHFWRLLVARPLVALSLCFC
jgi:hypothetical protein